MAASVYSIVLFNIGSFIYSGQHAADWEAASLLAHIVLRYQAVFEIMRVSLLEVYHVLYHKDQFNRTIPCLSFIISLT